MDIITTDKLSTKIYTIRGVQVMLDRDLAELYGVQTKVLNQAVKRNKSRFPDLFCFKINKNEFMNWRSQIVTSNSEKMGIRHLPFAFTEQGVAMLSTVIRSETAIKVSIEIINAFVEMRKIINNHNGLLQRIEGVERKLLESVHKFEQDSRYFIKVFFRIMTWI